MAMRWKKDDFSLLQLDFFDGECGCPSVERINTEKN